MPDYTLTDYFQNSHGLPVADILALIAEAAHDIPGITPGGMIRRSGQPLVPARSLTQSPPAVILVEIAFRSIGFVCPVDLNPTGGSNPEALVGDCPDGHV